MSRLLAAHRVQHAPQGQRHRRVGGQAELLRRDRLGRPGRELRPLPRQGPPRRDRRPPRVARVGGPGRPQAPGVEIIADSVQFLGGRDDGPAAAAAASRRAPTSRSTDRDFQPAGAPAGGGSSARRGRRHPVLGRALPRILTGGPRRRRALTARSAGAPERDLLHCATRALRARARSAPGADSLLRARVFQQWRSSAAGRRAGVTRRVGPAPVAASPASTAATRSTRSTTRTSRPCASSSPTAARSARAASRAPAAGTRTRSRRAVKRAREIALLPYVGDNREDRDERGRPRRDDRDRDRDR